MTTKRYTISEAGNGWPQIGDEILIEGACGWHTLAVVVSGGNIATHGSGRANTCDVETTEDGARDWDDLTDDEKDEAWESLAHVDLL